jgi:hypothetical protein
MDCDDDRPQRKTEQGEYIVTTEGVRLNGEGEGQIDGSKVDLGIGRGRSAGETVSAAYGFIGTRQNDSISAVSRVHLGNVD